MNQRKYIILGLTAQGLALLRELGRAGADVTAFCTSKKNVGYHSRYGTKILYGNVNELRMHIHKIISDAGLGKPICYITSGEILATVLREYKELYDECDVFSKPYPVIDMLAHKDRMYEYAIVNGFNVAKYSTLDKYHDGCLTFPLFLKRNYEIPLFFKAVKVGSPEELRSYMRKIPPENLKDVIAQEYIDIPPTRLINITCQGFFVDGQCAGTFIANQKRKLVRGITSYMEELPDSSLSFRVDKLARGFMEKLRYGGFAEFEFLYNTDMDNLYFLEVNTRPCGTQSALHYKFGNIADIILQPDRFMTLQPVTNGLRWMNIRRDIKARLEAKSFDHMGDIFKSKYDILDKNDLKPFFMQLI